MCRIWYSEVSGTHKGGVYIFPKLKDWFHRAQNNENAQTEDLPSYSHRIPYRAIATICIKKGQTNGAIKYTF